MGIGALFSLCAYDTKKETDKEDVAGLGLHVVTGGEEGSIAVLPYDTSAKWLNTATWSAACQELVHADGFGVTAVQSAHEYIYAASSHGWITVFKARTEYGATMTRGVVTQCHRAVARPREGGGVTSFWGARTAQEERPEHRRLSRTMEFSRVCSRVALLQTYRVETYSGRGPPLALHYYHHA